MESMQRHHPEWERFVLITGDTSPSPLDSELFTSVQLDEIPLPNRRQFCFRYNILELNTAVKPWMFEHLFEQGYDRVIYFDPDIVLYTTLFELDQRKNFIVLTPHLTGSIGGEDHPSERTILIAGTYNLGFLAVSRRAVLPDFLKWWQGKLEFHCVVDPARGLFVDQKWMDLVPGLFPEVEILRHDGYNVAYWNLRQRTVVDHKVNYERLRFFHFSGFNPAHPDLVSTHTDVKVVNAGDVALLIRDYAAALRTAGYESFKNASYAYGVFNDGTRIPDAARVAYRGSAP